MANPKAPTGYDPRFLGIAVPAPVPVDDPDAPVLDYQHFSVTMHRARRLAWSVAWSIDGLRLFPDIPRERGFFADERLPLDEQTTDAVYARNDLDRGHLARRADLLWGSLAQARAANRDSFCFTNVTPQHADFNQAGRGGAWGELEHAVLDLDGLHERRVVVFAGPVLDPGDPEYRGLVRLPREHWKVVVYRLGDAVRARAFLLAQDVSDVQPAYLDGFETYEVALDDLATRTGLDLSGIPLGTRSRSRTATPSTPRVIASVDDVDW
ncbi:MULTISPECIES: DNA/RNA non-specific endonuclease [unclassified Agrococcus]|uniref:DNA/RNA non-specific endonuclease n=1 Tax=unclassified Agrococcus TaxID=2615065 RepID=UPI00360931DF